MIGEKRAVADQRITEKQGKERNTARAVGKGKADSQAQETLYGSKEGPKMTHSEALALLAECRKKWSTVRFLPPSVCPERWRVIDWYAHAGLITCKERDEMRKHGVDPWSTDA